MSVVPHNNPSLRAIRYPTAKQWWESLGSVPMDRIVFDPPPGSATEKDVLRLDDHEDRICELVDGTLVEKTMGYEESALGFELGRLVANFVRARKLGIVTGEAGMMRILERRVRIPDVAFVSKARLPGGKFPRKPIPDLAPDLAVEIISESNTAKEMAIKLNEYFAAGTKLVWYVDTRTRTVEVYESPKKRKTLRQTQTLTGGRVLPGFSVKLSELFGVLDE